VGAVGAKTVVSWYDFMSYCADNGADDDSWISIVNYRRAFDELRALQKRRTNAIAARADQAQEPSAVLSVIGYVEGDSVVVTRLRPKAGDPALGPPDSPYRLLLRDAFGRVVGEAPMRVERSDGHGAGTEYVSADILLPDTAPGSLPQLLYAVEVVSQGRVRARIVRSANGPAVELLLPRAGQRVGGGPAVPVQWAARDADGGDLTASLDYSTDDGATWRTIAGGITTDRLSVPSRLLTSSNRARLRVRVSDGFNETAAISDRFVSLGAPPVVRITSPDRTTVVRSTEVLSLEATSYDDAFRPLRGRALVWFDERRRVATGEAASVTLRAAGWHRIRVVASVDS